MSNGDMNQRWYWGVVVSVFAVHSVIAALQGLGWVGQGVYWLALPFLAAITLIAGAMRLRHAGKNPALALVMLIPLAGFVIVIYAGMVATHRPDLTGGFKDNQRPAER